MPAILYVPINLCSEARPGVHILNDRHDPEQHYYNPVGYKPQPAIHALRFNHVRVLQLPSSLQRWT